ALLTVVKEVDNTNRKEDEELLRRKSKKDEKSIMVTPDGEEEIISVPEGSLDREDDLVPEAVPEFDGE
ncbi:MAG TPA: hypothetical protein PKV35_03305, partial [bacterium]|nr:hypothetical protein [bacterium]